MGASLQIRREKKGKRRQEETRLSPRIRLDDKIGLSI